MNINTEVFKIGDTVRVRRYKDICCELASGWEGEDPGFNDDMANQCGKLATIIASRAPYGWALHNSVFTYASQWLELVGRKQGEKNEF